MGRQRKITGNDYKLLARIIKIYKDSNKLSRHLFHLSEELENAVVINKSDFSTDFVRLNSTLVFKNLKTNKAGMVTVVLPSETSNDGSRISILSPLGAALIGETENSIVECYAPENKMQLRIEKIISHQHVLA